MSKKTTWDAEMVAKRLDALVSEHGVPNSFQLHEVADSTNPASALVISRLARLQGRRLNALLEPMRLRVEYQARHARDAPAYLRVTVLSTPAVAEG
jgi:hypothetical protein